MNGLVSGFTIFTRGHICIHIRVAHENIFSTNVNMLKFNKFIYSVYNVLILNVYGVYLNYLKCVLYVHTHLHCVFR